MIIDGMFRGEEKNAAALAQVSCSLEGGSWGAVADREYRYRPVLAPGGYRWRPSQGQEVLLLCTGDGELCAGATADSQDLADGEIEIAGPSGGSILLRADGAVVINGTVFPPAKEGS